MAIEYVKNNKEKGNTYTVMMSKYNQAIKNEFYFEAIFIDYAMLEDRLKSFLKYLGLIYIENKRIVINPNYEQSIYDLYYAYNSSYERGNKKINLDEIKVKIDLISYLLTSYKGNTLERYNLSNLKKVLNQLDVDLLRKTLNDLDKWRNDRNQLIHDLMEKDNNSINDNISTLAESGNDYVRLIDSQVYKIKSYIKKLLKSR